MDNLEEKKEQFQTAVREEIRNIKAAGENEWERLKEAIKMEPKRYLDFRKHTMLKNHGSQ